MIFIHLSIEKCIYIAWVLCHHGTVGTQVTEAMDSWQGVVLLYYTTSIVANISVPTFFKYYIRIVFIKPASNVDAD